MKRTLLLNMDDPRELEKLYRQDRTSFRQQFLENYPALKESKVAACWYERLNFEGEDMNWGKKGELVFVLAAAVVAGLLAKLPGLFNLQEEVFYERNIGFIVFPVLIAYFAWKHALTINAILPMGVLLLGALLFINLLPPPETGDSLRLAALHLPLLLWSIAGFAFMGGDLRNQEKRLDFLRYTGDLAVMMAVIVIAGGILTAITIGLFQLIGLRIEKFYFENVVVFAAAAIPVIGTYLTSTNPQIVSKVSPVIARIFSPLVLVTLVVYLIAILYAGKNLYHDREFLLVFNGLLIGVLALILFSVAGTSNTGSSKLEIGILFFLSMLTVIVNGIALSAILFRISAWGITPNRMAVLGANVLMLIHLVMVTIKLYKAWQDNRNTPGVGVTMGLFLPVYAGWAFVVVFIFPLLFGFK